MCIVFPRTWRAGNGLYCAILCTGWLISSWEFFLTNLMILIHHLYPGKAEQLPNTFELKMVSSGFLKEVQRTA